jgi:hypothetical protein
MFTREELKKALEKIGYRISEQGTGHGWIFNHKNEHTGILVFGERVEYKTDKHITFYFNRNHCDITVHEPDTKDGKMAVSIGTDDNFIQLYNY